MDASPVGASLSDLFDHVAFNRVEALAKVLVNEGDAALAAVHPTTGDNALMLACRLGKTAAAELCLEAGMHYDPHPKWGQNALQVAVDNGSSDCTALLLMAAVQAGMGGAAANMGCMDDFKRTRRGKEGLGMKLQFYTP